MDYSVRTALVQWKIRSNNYSISFLRQKMLRNSRHSAMS